MCLCYAVVFLTPALAGPLAWLTSMDRAALPSDTPTQSPNWPLTWTLTVTRTPQPGNTPVKIGALALTSTLMPTVVNVTAAAGSKHIGQSALFPAIANRTALLRVPVLKCAI